jgi:hypothetical protein
VPLTQDKTGNLAHLSEFILCYSLVNEINAFIYLIYIIHHSFIHSFIESFFESLIHSPTKLTLTLSPIYIIFGSNNVKNTPAIY